MSSDENPYKSVSIKYLSEKDGRALDVLLADRAGEAPDGAAALDGDLAGRVQRLDGLLKLLEAAPVEDGDPMLADRTIARVRAARQREQVATQAQMVARGTAGGGAGTGLWQILLTAAMLVVAVSLLFPFLERNRAEARRITCATNLQTAGVAFGQYAVDFDGVLPRGHVQPGATWWNVGQADADRDGPIRSNSAHLYLLVRSGYIDPDQLACPENEHAPRGVLTAQHHDWPSAAAVSYSYQNQYTPRPIRLSVNGLLAVLADKNPLFVPRGQGVAFDDQTPAVAPSRVHGNRGQNVLTADGSVRWTVRPLLPRSGAGDADNIWVVQGIHRYTGTETPRSLDDSFLVP